MQWPHSTHSHSMASTAPTDSKLGRHCSRMHILVHSPWLHHWCPAIRSHYINNGWAFSRQTSFRTGVYKLRPMGQIWPVVVFVNKVFLEYSHIHLFKYVLQCLPVAELSSVTETITCKDKIFSIYRGWLLVSQKGEKRATTDKNALKWKLSGHFYFYISLPPKQL